MIINLKIFIIFSVITLLLGVLSYYVRREYRNSLVSIEIKEKGILHFYRFYLSSLFTPREYKPYKIIFLFWLHYILLHAFTPFLLSIFLLKSDWNVLIAIISLIVSTKIFQRVYPTLPK